MSWSGHDEAWREWRAALASPRLHHAWILAGIRGLGKGSFARAAAAGLVAEAGIPQPDVTTHPDIVVLEALPANDTEEEKRAAGKPYLTKRNITIDQVRQMQRRLVTRPTLGSRRAIIIDPADEMEKGAVNALLKSLEEPPAGTYFILVSHRPGRLLPTIRSRCRILRFAPLDAAEVGRIIAREAPEADGATRDAAVAAAEGSPGAALEFVGQGLGELHRIMLAILTDGDAQFARRGALAEAIGPRADRERLQAVTDLARAVLAEKLDRAPAEVQQRIIAAHAELVRLTGQIASFNYDPGLLVMEIGGLLAGAAMPREAAI